MTHDEKNDFIEEVSHYWQKTSDGHVFYWAIGRGHSGLCDLGSRPLLGKG
jgi:hypothetical protein